MNIRTMVMVGIFGAGALAAAGLVGAAEVMYDGAGFVRGQQSGMESFSVSGPGTLTVQLSNVAWPVSLSSLDAVISTASGLLGPEMGAGTESFQLQTSGEVFAQWFGTAQGPLDTGVYAMKVEFQPNAMAVPLPTSIGLLVSGLALLGWQRRRSNVEPLLEAELTSRL